MVISNKHGINELPHELPNGLTLRKLGKINKNLKTSYTYILGPGRGGGGGGGGGAKSSTPPPPQIPLTLAEN